MSDHIFIKVIIASVSGNLTASGYQRRGQTFISEREDVSLLINLQSSTKTTKDKLVITLNLGSYSVILAKKLEDEARTDSIWNCHWRQRIGSVSPEHKDIWWEISDTFEAENTGKELVILLKNYGLPALETVSSTASLLSLWQSGISPGLTNTQRSQYLALLE